MRKLIITVSLVTILFSFGSCGRNPESGTISLSGAWALYPLAVRWNEEYAKINAGIRIQVTGGGAGKGMSDAQAGLVDVAMISRSVTTEEKSKGALAFAVAKDAVVPTVNAGNPQLGLILRRGLTREELKSIWIDVKPTLWEQIPGFAKAGRINVYTRSDACGAGQVWAEYLGGKGQDDLAGVKVESDPGIAEAVLRDKLAVGYNNIGFAYDAKTLKPVAGLEILPIDFNANGKIDPDENVYATRRELMKAIQEGKYPSPPARNLFFVTKGKSPKQAVRDFINWVLTSGQAFVEDAGYIQLKPEELKLSLDTLAK